MKLSEPIDLNDLPPGRYTVQLVPKNLKVHVSEDRYVSFEIGKVRVVKNEQS